MQIKKKSLVLIVLVLTLSHALVFSVGGIIGKKAMYERIAQEGDEVNAHIGLSHYSHYRDIALDIKANHYVDATCKAEMMATTMFEGLDTCIADSQCKSGLEKSARQFAPEILEGTAMPIEKRNSCPRQNR